MKLSFLINTPGMKKIFTLPIICFITITAVAQPGSLDSTFSSDGKLVVPVGSADDYGKSVAIQADGKILVAGYSATGAGYDFSLLRFNSDGTTDNSFGSSGVVLTDFGGSTDEAYAVLVQPDGKIVVAGKGMATYTDDPSTYDFAVARYNANGTPDNTFGVGGKVLTDLGSLSSDFACAAALQADGKIVLAGYTSDGVGAPDFAIARYNSNGTLDSTFAGGVVILDIAGGTWDVAYSVLVQSDQKILVGGCTANSGAYDFALARFNSNGTPDGSFDTDGKLTADLGGMYDLVLSMALQSDGKILAAGHSHNGSDYDFALARFNSDGSFDNTFDGDGKLNAGFGTSSSEQATSVAVQADGKILLAGNASAGSSSGADFALMRFNSDGSFDNSFDSDGKVLTDFGGTLNSEYINSIALQPDGKIVAVGDKGQNFSSTSFVWDVAIARYNVAALSSGIAENTEPNFGIYPNPSNGIFQFVGNTTEPATIEVFNSMGERIKEVKINSEKQIDLSAQPAGIYFMKIVCADRHVLKKLVLEK
jgi:uncharacterized delta-60 repeat protein